MNVVSTQRGSIRKRNGSQQFLSENVPNVELDSFFASHSLNEPWGILSGAGKLYSVDAFGKPTEIGKGFTAGDRWTTVQAPLSKEVAGQGPFYMTNGVDKPQYWKPTEEVKPWTGATEVTLGETKVPCYEDPITKEHVPNGKYSIYAGNRIWMAGISSDPMAVWFSEDVSIGEGGEQADPSFWPKTNVVRFDSADGEPISGIGVIGPYILVFKRSKTWALHNLNTGENRKLSDTIGCAAHRSIVETQVGTFFLTADQGIYLTNGSTLTEVSSNVRPTILGINPAMAPYAAGAYIANHYYLSYAAGASETNNRTLDYDLQLKSWWLHDLAANQWAVYQPTPGSKNTAMYGIPPGTKKGVVEAWVAGLYTDSGENYTGNGTLGAFWLSSWDPWAFYIQRHRLKAPFIKKRVRQIWFAGEGQIIPVIFKDFHVGERQEPAVVANKEISTEDTLPVDFSAGEQTWGESPEKWGEGTGVEVLWGGEVSIGQARMYALGVCNMLSVGWGNNSDQPFTVDAYMTAISFRKS